MSYIESTSQLALHDIVLQGYVWVNSIMRTHSPSRAQDGAVSSWSGSSPVTAERLDILKRCDTECGGASRCLTFTMGHNEIYLWVCKEESRCLPAQEHLQGTDLSAGRNKLAPDHSLNVLEIKSEGDGRSPRSLIV